MTSWDVIYENGIPVQMRWNPRGRRSLPCPRTWPHDPHEPWFDGAARSLGDPDAVGFACPGRAIERHIDEGREETT